VRWNAPDGPAPVRLCRRRREPWPGPVRGLPLAPVAEAARVPGPTRQPFSTGARGPALRRALAAAVESVPVIPLLRTLGAPARTLAREALAWRPRPRGPAQARPIAARWRVAPVAPSVDATRAPDPLRRRPARGSRAAGRTMAARPGAATSFGSDGRIRLEPQDARPPCPVAAAALRTGGRSAGHPSSPGCSERSASSAETPEVRVRITHAMSQAHHNHDRRPGWRVSSSSSGPTVPSHRGASARSISGT
jgi:hypothetical protein